MSLRFHWSLSQVGDKFRRANATADMKGLFSLAEQINLVQSAAQYFQVVITENAGQKAIHNIREALFSHLQKISIDFYDRNPVGKLMTRLTNDVDSLTELFSSGIVTVFSQGCGSALHRHLDDMDQPISGVCFLRHFICDSSFHNLVPKNGPADIPAFSRASDFAQYLFAGAFDGYAGNPNVYPRGQGTENI